MLCFPVFPLVLRIGSGLNLDDLYLESLEIVSRLPVPEIHCSIISTGHHHSISIGSKAVDNGIMSREVLKKEKDYNAVGKSSVLYLNELSIRTSPLLDVVRPSTGKHEQLGVSDQPSHRLLVVGQGGNRLACG